MANIPVERTGGASSFLPWLIGLIVLALVAWLLFALLGNGDDARTGEPITDPQVLSDPEDDRSPVGERVRLENMRVEVAYSDSIFYASPTQDTPDRRYFVVLGDPAMPGVGGPTTLQVGQQVTVHGTVAEPDRQRLEQWNIAQDERDRLMRYEDHYVRADRVDQ